MVCLTVNRQAVVSTLTAGGTHIADVGALLHLRQILPEQLIHRRIQHDADTAVVLCQQLSHTVTVRMLHADEGKQTNASHAAQFFLPQSPLDSIVFHTVHALHLLCTI